MAIFLEIEPVLLYFPVDSVSGLSYASINEAIQDSVIESKNEDNILVLRYANFKYIIERIIYFYVFILIFRLPSLLLKSSTLKQNLLSFCVYGLPVKLPSEIWDQSNIYSINTNIVFLTKLILYYFSCLLAKNSYPWTVSMKNFNCSTLSCKLSKEFPHGRVVETNILKQFSSDLTISFTPKSQKKPEINVEKSKASENIDSNSKNTSSNNPEHQSSVSFNTTTYILYYLFHFHSMYNFIFSMILYLF